MQIVNVKISELIPADYNPRRLTEKQGLDIRKSLESFGFVDPVIVNQHPDRLNVIIGGHQRVKVWELMGNDTVPVVFVNLEEARERELNVRLNKNSGEWDWDVLANQFDVDNLKAWGFDDGEFGFEQLAPDETIGDDEVGEPPESPITVLGDLYELGTHRLLCGDSTSTDAVEKLLDGQKADMVFTDPPYGMFLNTDYDSMFSSDAKHQKTGKRFDAVKGDHEDFNPEFINTIFSMFDYCKEIFLWGADYYVDLIPNRNAGSWVVWDKRCGENMDKVVGNTFELCWSRAKHKRMVARILWSGHHGMQKDDTKKRVHPTQKPVELVCWFFDYYSMADKRIVVDLFGGSGSTLIACDKTGRHSRLIELDPKYCDVIVKRYIKFCLKNNREVKVLRNGYPCHEFSVEKSIDAKS